MTPALLCDEMLGRLARWLRLAGLDVAYVKGVHDDVLVAAAKAQGRRLVTRDAALAARVPGAVRLRRLDLPGQLREVLAAVGPVDPARAMTRCARCNHPLEPAPREEAESAVPPAVRAAPRDYWRCPSCGQVYWRGSHAARIEAALRHAAADAARETARGAAGDAAGEGAEREP